VREMSEETGFAITKEDAKLYRSKARSRNQIFVFFETPAYASEIIH
jgi:hypothetical protein